jgi:TolA-binding protein
MRFYRLIVLSVAATAAFGQDTKDLVRYLQRDVALLQADMSSTHRMLEGLDAKLDSLTALMRETAENSNRATSALEKRFDERLAAQEQSLVAPVAGIGAKVDTMTDEFRYVRESVADINTRLRQLSTQVVDLNNTIQVMQAPPLPPGAEGPTAANAPAPNGPPAGLSADRLYADARRDMNAGNNEIAMQEFQDYLRWFDNTPYASNAQFYIGNIHLNEQRFPEALAAFNLVLEKYPANNNKAVDAAYMKAKTLAQMGRQSAAEQEFKLLIEKHPGHELAAKAKAELSALGVSP